ncbi:sensor histidine kinase [Clostridium porci]|nr:GHKL domain-containing protein [Clostridium porci]
MVIFLINSLFGIFLTYKMLGILLKRLRISVKACILLYFIYYIINNQIYFLFKNDKITLISDYICLYIIVFIAYDESIWKNILVPVLLATISYCTEELFWYLMMMFFKTPDATVIAVLSNFMLCIILAFLQEHFNRGMNDLRLRYENLLLIMLPITSIFVVMAIDTKMNPELKAGGIFGIILLNIVVFYLYERLTSAYEKEMEQSLLRQQLRQYENQLELMRESVRQIRSIRHDIKNHVIVVKQLLDDKKIDEIRDYLKQLEDVMVTNREYAKTGNDCVDSIINYYMDEAKMMGVTTELILKIPESLPIASLDISIILGNLLQNAVEALKKCEGDKRVCVLLSMEKGTLRLRIINTYDGAPIMSNGKRLQTSKAMETDHGFGLQYVKEAINRYNGKMEYKIRADEFEVNAFMLIGEDS